MHGGDSGSGREVGKPNVPNKRWQGFEPCQRYKHDKTASLSSASNFPICSIPFIQRNEVFTWFGGKKAFLNYHGQKYGFNEKWYENNWIEIE